MKILGAALQAVGKRGPWDGLHESEGEAQTWTILVDWDVSPVKETSAALWMDNAQDREGSEGSERA